ncbi:MAG: hypothetical protein KAS17_10900, partial [Victivallaceae bacterium]|nr:hypothetical protein [Victivallaceae bacterium]
NCPSCSKEITLTIDENLSKKDVKEEMQLERGNMKSRFDKSEKIILMFVVAVLIFISWFVVSTIQIKRQEKRFSFLIEDAYKLIGSNDFKQACENLESALKIKLRNKNKVRAAQKLLKGCKKIQKNEFVNQILLKMSKEQFIAYTKYKQLHQHFFEDIELNKAFIRKLLAIRMDAPWIRKMLSNKIKAKEIARKKATENAREVYAIALEKIRLNSIKEQKALLIVSGIPSDNDKFEDLVNSLEYNARVRVWAKQFNRSERWVKFHTFSYDSARDANLKLVRAYTKESF